jgi:type III pantothenate kinase
MNLILDIGNSSTKVAFFSNDEKITISRYDSISGNILNEILSGHNLEKGIVSSVKDIPEYLLRTLERRIPAFHIMSYKSKIPFPINYRTPQTLGTDRLAAVAGACKLFPGNSFLIIDAGSALTFDFFDGTQYCGGNISPGIDMRFTALNKFTGKLPKVSISDDFSFPGNSTRDAIIAGVVTGVIYEINEYIRTFEKKDKDLKTILTGGDGNYLKHRIPEKTIYLPDIVAYGLNYILEYNAK